MIEFQAFRNAAPGTTSTKSLASHSDSLGATPLLIFFGAEGHDMILS